MTQENIPSLPSQPFIFLTLSQRFRKDGLIIPPASRMVVEVFTDCWDRCVTDQGWATSGDHVGEEANGYGTSAHILPKEILNRIGRNKKGEETQRTD